MPWREGLYPQLTEEIAAYLASLSVQEAGRIREIRAYAGGEFVLAAGRMRIRTDVKAGRAEMDALLSALSGYALYSVERQMAGGYIPLPGGHRAGVCGRMAQQEDGSWRMDEVTSVCIRIARHIPGASLPIRRFLLRENGLARRVLILGPPGCGKTTVLRDAAVFLAHEAGLHVAAADEREEIFPCLPEVCRSGIDVLSGMDKAQAFSLLLRSMSPQVLVGDEIGDRRDALAMEDAVRCGVGVIATAHADALEGIDGRPVLRRLVRDGAFDACILLGERGAVRRVRNGNGCGIAHEEDGYGELGCGGHDDDCPEHGGLSAFGRGKTARRLDPRDAPLSSEDERRHPV